MARSENSIDRFIGVELGEYRIESVIGRGGMGVVYLARDDLDKPVALKLMVPELANNQQFRERFIREAQAVIDHPNIVRVFEAGEIDGLLYMAMEYVEGSDLKVVIERDGRLLPARAVSIFSQAAHALDAAHEKGIVHRDVKPQNILIGHAEEADQPEHVYLSDFGLVKRTASQSSFTESAYLMGTIQYMSPEQIEGKPIDGRADVYSLGCVLYEGLTGAVPFDKDSDVAVMWAHIQEEPPSATRKCPVLPSGVDRVLAKAMAKSRDDRYLTCGEMTTDLAQELGVQTARRSGSWSSDISLSGSRRRPRPTSGGPHPGRKPATERTRRSGSVWIAAALSISVLGGALLISRREPAPVSANAAPPGASAGETASSGAPGKVDKQRQDPKRTRKKRNDESKKRRRKTARGDRVLAVGGSTEAPSAANDAPGTAAEGAAVSSVPRAPLSGNYLFSQDGYDQRCLNACDQGRDLPASSTVQVYRTSSDASAVNVVTTTRLSDRWSTQITTQFSRTRAFITDIKMTHSGELGFRQHIRADPLIEWLRFPLTKGAGWSGRWDDEDASDAATSGDYEVRITGSERLRINGRSVQTFRVDATLDFFGEHTGTWEIRAWIDPNTRMTVQTRTFITMESYKASSFMKLKSGPGY